MEGPTIHPTHSQPILAPREIEAAATDGSRWCPFPFPVQRVSFARLSAQEEVPGERLKAGCGSNSTPSSHPPLAYGCTYGFGVAVSSLIGSIRLIHTITRGILEQAVRVPSGTINPVRKPARRERPGNDHPFRGLNWCTAAGRDDRLRSGFETPSAGVKGWSRVVAPVSTETTTLEGGGWPPNLPLQSWVINHLLLLTPPRRGLNWCTGEGRNDSEQPGF